MRAVLLEVPEAMLAERCRLGLEHPEGHWVELLRAVGDQLLPVTADAGGSVRSEVLGAQFTTVEGRLHITGEDSVADV